MTRSTHRAALLALAAGTVSLPARALDPAPSAPSPLAAALASRFAACLAAEGPALSPDDRASLDELAPTLESAYRAAGRCEGPPDACAATVATVDCDALARTLAPPDGPTDTLATEALATGPSAPWATAFARDLVARIATCASAESDAGVLDASARAALDGYTDTLAGALTVAASGGHCRVDEHALDACRASFATLACDALGDHLGEGAGALAHDGAGSTEGPCSTWLVCDIDPGADEHASTRGAANAR